MFDLLLKGGLVVDGTGAPPRTADVAIVDGQIAAIGPGIEGSASEVVDATGKLVTPGFIDIHTHYDGQVTWDGQLLPTSAHGVTTIVIGCCGIGFAPVRKGAEDWLIRLTEGVEDIPGTALHVGIPWGWQTYPEYLDALSRRDYVLDIAAQVPHSAVRAYVLDKRAERDEPATDDDLTQIATIVREAIEAGAVGVGTSRVSMHRGSDGGTLPGTRAPEDELLTIARAMREGGGGVFQIIPSGITGGVEGQSGEQTLAGLAHLRDAHTITTEIEMMRRLHHETGQPITFTFAESPALGKEEFERARGVISAIAKAGEKIYPQFSPRAVGGLIALDTYHLFTARPSYRAIAHLPVGERAAAMADPATKAAILAEADIDPGTDDPMQHMHETLQRNLGAIYSLQSVDYEPDPSQSVLAIANAAGRDPFDLLYDLLIVDDGSAVLIWFTTGYLDGDLRTVAEFLDDPQYVMGLGDGGAHVQFICDASFPTFLLAHWGKTRDRGPIFPIEQLVKKITKDPADLYSFHDRGVIATGRRADINVIDFDRLAISRPRLAHDLPAGAQRFLQDASGYALTIVNGVIVRRDDQDTGARPGRLVRKRRSEAAHQDGPKYVKVSTEPAVVH